MSVCLALLLLFSPVIEGRALASEAPEPPWKISPTISFFVHKEQLKNAAGTPVQQLASQRELALMTTGTYSLHPAVDAGLFFLAEKGARTLIGGGPTDYTLFWVGPMVRGNWKSLFLEICYVLIGTRSDAGLSSIASMNGDRSSAFETDPAKAWLFTLGGTIPLIESLDLVLKLEYRYHYYDERGDDELQANASLGSQAIRPHLGVQWRL